ncbi:MAG: response regulator [Chloroflexi bacterium]|nr:response regulator [Chloroflexota bacterium]
MKRICLIDDDPIITHIYQELFQRENFQVDVAADGEIALQTIKQNTPDVVLLDLMLPKVNGIEVLKRIRAAPATQKTPVIAFTSTYLSTLLESAWKAGATKCLTKTDCTSDQLLKVVRSTMAYASQPAPSSGAARAQDLPLRGPSGPGEPPLHDTAIGTLGTDADTTFFQAEIRRSFLQGAPQILAALRSRLQAFARSDVPARLLQLFELCRSVHSLTGNAGIAGCGQVAQMSSALETLLKELYEEPTSINVSTLRTVAHAVDFLSVLIAQAAKQKPELSMPALVLVVDDEIMSRWTLCSALELANLRSVCLDDPRIALAVLEQNRFDLIFLDVEMPGKSGFELCAELRASSLNKTTPVVFVTGLTDFESRARSTLSGGNDFIAKPFLLIELAVKALIYVLKSQIKDEPQESA